MSDLPVCPTCGRSPSGRRSRSNNGLVRLREERGWTMRIVCARSGVNINSISRVEHGENARVSSVVALANAYGITVDELLRLREEKDAS